MHVPVHGAADHAADVALYLYILVNRAADRARYVAADARALLDETATYWDYVEAETVLAERQPCVRVYLTQNDVGEAQLRDLRAMVESLKGIEGGLDLGSLDVVVEIAKDEDWANNWK